MLARWNRVAVVPVVAAERDRRRAAGLPGLWAVTFRPYLLCYADSLAPEIFLHAKAIFLHRIRRAPAPEQIVGMG